MKIKTAINSLYLSRRSIRDNNRPAHYKNFCDYIKTLYFKVHSVQIISGPIKGIEQRYENEKSIIMNEFDNFFNF